MTQIFCESIGKFYEGLAVATEITGNQTKYFHILQDGSPAYPERYDMAEYFQNGFAWVRRGNEYLKIDKQGREIKMRNTQDPLC